VQISQAIYSYNRQKSFKAFFWNGRAILSQCIDICMDSLFYVGDCLFSGLPLTDATREAWNFCHPIVVLARVDHHLTHRLLVLFSTI